MKNPDSRITIRLDETMMQQLDRAAEQMRQAPLHIKPTRTDIVRRALEEFLQRQARKAKAS
jgi:metal-responsive CopG/Arc/MetJ family transcriptional regulator